MKHLFTMMLALVAVTASAQTFEVDGICYNILSEDDRTVEVTYNYDSYAGDIVIPAEITQDGLTYSVTTIGDYAFSSCSALTSVSMPSVVTIGNSAFSDCYSLSSIEMSSITAISEEAFYKCYSLQSVAIPSTVAAIGTGAFAGCISLKEIIVDEANSHYASIDGILYDKGVTTLLCCPGAKNAVNVPGTVTTVAESAFEGCGALNSVEMNSVTTIDDYAFYDCMLLESIEMNSVITIGDFAITYCNSLTSINIPSTVTTIGTVAFGGCPRLKEIIVDEANANYSSVDGVLYDKEVSTLLCCPGAKSVVSVPNSVATVSYGAFAESQSLTSVSMPSVTTIGESAFEFCTSLESVEMPSVITISDYAFFECTQLLSADMSSVETIGIQAFSGCKSMPLIDIPSTTKSIDRLAFDACFSLREIYCHWVEPLECEYLFNDEVTANATLYVPIGTVDAYRSVYPWSGFINIVERDYSGISATPGSGLSVKVIDGAIVVEGGDMAVSAPVVEVYSAGGGCVYRGTDTVISGLTHGVYVVKVGDTVQKVML